MVVIMTDLQDFCQEHRSMDELVEAGYKPTNVYNAVKRKELTNTKATDDWGRKLHGKGLFLSTVTVEPMNFTALQSAWHTPQPQGETA
jgi:hypothetical protein